MSTTPSAPSAPSRGDVWVADLEPVVGHEQGGAPRPVVIVSSNRLNHGPARLVIVIPMSTTDRGIPLHVRVEPPEGGIRRPSFLMIEQLRSISLDRLSERWGAVTPETMVRISKNVNLLLEF